MNNDLVKKFIENYKPGDNLKKPEQLKNRLYDRHISRTGRGKEISKGGSGGKYTWKGHGNLIREAYSDEIQIDNYDYDYE